MTENVPISPESLQPGHEADASKSNSEAGLDPGSRPLRISINKNMIDKNDGGDRSLYAEGWENVEFTQAELIAQISAGVAYCSQLSGRRRAANFMGTDVVSVDVDRGMSVQDALSLPIVRDHAAFLYTTVNHTPEAPRFRLVFILPRTIHVADEIRALSRSLALRLGGDMAATDPCRISFGNRSAESSVVGKTLTPSLVRELIDQSINLPDGTSSGESYTSRLTLNSDQPVRRESGSTAAFAQLEHRERVFCPFHDDKTASAFVVRSGNGQKGLHCSACRATYWLSREGEYDFNDFERRARAAATGEISGAFQDVMVTVGTRVTTPSRLLHPLTFIKAPKGTGKTEGLRGVIGHRDKVLLIGHRRLLNRQSARRLGLHSYLDKDSPRPWRNERDERLKKFAVSVDSLHLVPSTMEYDLVIIDESEQVLSHFLSDTIGQDARDDLFIQFGNLLRRAKRIVALDADLGWLTFYTLWQIKFGSDSETHGRPVPSPSEFMAAAPENTLEQFFEQSDRPTSAMRSWLIINESLPGVGRKLEVYASPRHLVGDLMKALEDGKRCLVVSNSKTKIETIATAIRNQMPAIRLLEATSDTSGSNDVQRFIAEPAAEYDNYDVVLASPTMGTGVDITFPENEERVDIVFGFCEANITTHFDFDQQLGRVRHPKAVKVWLSPQIFHYETSEDVVRYEILQKKLIGSRLSGYTPDGRPIHRSGDLLLEMAALSMSQRLASMNKIKANFVRHKEHEGFEIEFISTDDTQAVVGASAYALGSSLREEDYARQLLAASTLTKSSFSRLLDASNRGETISIADRWSIERTFLELFYRARLTEKLTIKDERGKARRKVRLFEEVQKLASTDIQQPDQFSPRDRFLRGPLGDAKALLKVLRMTPIFDGSRFRPDAMIQGADLVDLATFVTREKATLENLLAMEMRADVRRKPVLQLGRFLSLMGLHLVPAGSKKVDGKKLRFYRLDDDALKQITAVVNTRRRESDPWSTLRRIHRWTLTEEDSDDDDDPDWQT